MGIFQVRLQVADVSTITALLSMTGGSVTHRVVEAAASRERIEFFLSE